MDGYRDIYYALIFFLPGALLGMALTKRRWRWFEIASLLVLDGFLAPLALQWILMDATGGSLSLANFGISFGMIVLGFLWAKSDSGSEVNNAAVCG